MLSKSEISYIKSLHLKKFRKEHGLFLAEGLKSVTEFIHSDYVTQAVYATPALHPKLAKFSQKIKLIEVTENEISKISSLTTPQGILSIVQIPSKTDIPAESLNHKFTLMLDGVQDPGNLGTIIRTADWFGFTEIVCSEDTVEAYNPKVVQATMGSLSRIKIHYSDLPLLLNNVNVPVYGALLDGSSIYSTDFESWGVLILGNEGKGISPEVQRNITHPVTIPRFGAAESLNVAISAAIFCSELKRKTLK